MRFAATTTRARPCACHVHRIALEDDRDEPASGGGGPATPGRDTPDARLRRLVREWIASSRDALTEEQILQALRTGKAAILSGDPVWVESWEDDFNDDWQEGLRRIMRKAGAAELRRLDLALSFDLDNPYATRFAIKQTATMVTAVSDETRAAIRGVIGAGFIEGFPPRDMAALIKPTIGLTARDARAVRNRAAALAEDLTPEQVAKQTARYANKLLNRRCDNISRTETIGSQNAGQDAAWQSATDAGLVDPGAVRRWVSTPSSGRTCDLCAPMQGAEAKLDEPFTTPDGRSIDRPPLHPSCFAAGTVVCGPRVLASTDRLYRGEVVEIECGAGRVTVTPNHPLLTPEGWVAAGELHEGGHLVCCGDRERMVAAIHPHDHQAPALIEEVVEACGRASKVAPALVPVAAEDFHGDGVGSEVYVVRTDGLLRNRGDASLLEPDRKQDLVRAGVEASGFARLGALDGCPDETRPTLGGGVRGLGEGAVHLRCAAGGHQPVGDKRSPDFDAGLDKAATNPASVHPVGAGERKLGLAGAVARSDFGDRQVAPSAPRMVRDAGLLDAAVDHDGRDAEACRDGECSLAGGVARHHLGVVEDVAVTFLLWRIDRIERRPFEGHVYNLQTLGEWYTANSIVAHNCRCSMTLHQP